METPWQMEQPPDARTIHKKCEWNANRRFEREYFEGSSTKMAYMCKELALLCRMEKKSCNGRGPSFFFDFFTIGVLMALGERIAFVSKFQNGRERISDWLCYVLVRFLEKSRFWRFWKQPRVQGRSRGYSGRTRLAYLCVENKKTRFSRFSFFFFHVFSCKLP